MIHNVSLIKCTIAQRNKERTSLCILLRLKPCRIQRSLDLVRDLRRPGRWVLQLVSLGREPAVVIQQRMRCARGDGRVLGGPVGGDDDDGARRFGGVELEDLRGFLAQGAREVCVARVTQDGERPAAVGDGDYSAAGHGGRGGGCGFVFEEGKVQLAEECVCAWDLDHVAVGGKEEAQGEAQ